MTISDLEIEPEYTSGSRRQRVSYRGHLLAILIPLPRSDKWLIDRATVRCVDSWTECATVGALEWDEMLQTIIELTVVNRL